MFKKTYRLVLTGICAVSISTSAHAQQKVKLAAQPGTILTRWAKLGEPIKSAAGIPSSPACPQAVDQSEWFMGLCHNR